MNSRCLSVNSQLEHEFNSNMVYPQAILIEDINEDGVFTVKFNTNYSPTNFKFFLKEKWNRYWFSEWRDFCLQGLNGSSMAEVF